MATYGEIWSTSKTGPPAQSPTQVFLRPTLEKFSNSNKTCVLAGDFNVDLLKYGHNSHSDDFFDEISGFSFRPLVLQPSRINNRSFTLIDNIFINDSSCSSSGGNITSSISDHLSQFSFKHSSKWP